MDKFLNNGAVQLAGILVTALSAYGVARFTRSGAREANQTVGWTNLVSALQKEVVELRSEQSREETATLSRFKEMEQNNRELSSRVLRLERSRYRWKHWGQQVVPLLQGNGFHFPPPPESLEDTDPDMLGV